jgi:hypothetical protein
MYSSKHVYKHQHGEHMKPVCLRRWGPSKKIYMIICKPVLITNLKQHMCRMLTNQTLGVLHRGRCAGAPHSSRFKKFALQRTTMQRCVCVFSRHVQSIQSQTFVCVGGCFRSVLKGRSSQWTCQQRNQLVRVKEREDQRPMLSSASRIFRRIVLPMRRW